MASVNKVILVGNLGRDPELRYSPDGGAICTLSVATTAAWKDKQTGEKQEETEWHRVVCFKRLAEVASEYLKKGSSCYFEGRLKTRKWTDKNGVERYTTEIVADVLTMLGTPRGSEEPQHEVAQAAKAATRTQKNDGAGVGGMDDDVPF